MENRTQKALMLGGIILLCGLTSLFSSIIGKQDKTSSLVRADKYSAVGFADKNKDSNGKLAAGRYNGKVYVSGAVRRPGIYEVPAGARADDAITSAGGMTNDADPNRVNLALKLKDGMHINVPYAKAVNGFRNKGTTNKSYAKHEAIGDKAYRNRIININSASAKELKGVPGIGPSMAQKILNYRRMRNFSTVEELLKIPGIGKAKLERLRPYICV